jgi:hypothetical protein
MRFRTAMIVALFFNVAVTTSGLADTGPALDDCHAWEPMYRSAYQANAQGRDRNDAIGTTIQDVHQRGWPEDSAKQIFMIILDAYAGNSRSVDQFIAEQLKKCESLAGVVGPKFPHVTLGVYWPEQAKAEAKEEWRKTQSKNQDRTLRMPGCLQYKAMAILAMQYESSGLPADTAQNVIVARAYGPGGQVYRGSEKAEQILSRLVKAVYSQSRQAIKDFPDYAYSRCLDGKPL